ncbi:MAG: PhoPQ-activated pathogenicity-related family protein [Phycisphaerales bacterium]|nr:PhoPQ-activated pathogenicity-related family protein [Phycisphaerales bacterium]
MITRFLPANSLRAAICSLAALALAPQSPATPAADVTDVTNVADSAAQRLAMGAPATTAPDQATALEKYIALDDGAFTWELVKSTRIEGVISGSWHALRMTSQVWRTKDEVNIPEWTHWVCIWVPDRLVSDKPILFIGGGRRRSEPPAAPPFELQMLAPAGAIAVTIDNVPNQPLRLNGDPADRNEDALVARTWVNAIQTGDPTWIARFPMVKAAVKAIDTTEQFLARHPQEKPSFNGKQLTKDFKPGPFLVAGGSKRGWTTWLTGAVDKRVGAIAPLVIDVLDLPAQMRHHHAVYGFWSPALNDYVETGFTDRFLKADGAVDPGLAAVLAHDDPVHWLSRVGSKPKYIINATGDEFFLPDSSQFYEGKLPQPWMLRYQPNCGHGLKDSSAVADLIAFYRAWTGGAGGSALPTLNWSVEPAESAGGLRVKLTSSRAPTATRLWSAKTESARDFRFNQTGKAWTSTDLAPASAERTLHVAELRPPNSGFAAYFIECQYAMPGGLPPLTLTSRVFVLPDGLPAAKK